MFGWNGKFLRVNLDKLKAAVKKYDADTAINYLGGRGFAVKILWDELDPGIDPLSSRNKLIMAAGPLTGFDLPSSCKLVVASKSPLTGGYGDGNIGTFAAVEMRRAGYDALILEGRSKAPIVLVIMDRKVDFIGAEELWGLSSFKAENILRQKYGATAGILTIGPAGENLVKFANIVCQEGRAGGRPGIGAVMGSKKLKAVVILGSNDPEVFDARRLKELGTEAYREVLTKPSYSFWKKQGTMMTIEWSQENSVLPSYNFQEGVFEDADAIGGFSMEKMKTSQRGCPKCNMTCGNVIRDSYRRESEIDYENVAMLGSNIGLGNLRRVAGLNRVADEQGLDTISLGNVLGFAMEASEKGLIKERIPWGKFKETKNLIEDISKRRDIGDMLAEGVRFMAEKIGGDSSQWAMHVKGLEVTGYNCHAAPAMALAFGTSSIGAHHKDAWVIAWEVKTGREGYGVEKVDKVIEFQRIRGGVFESLSVCRLPWIELGFKLDWYTKFLHAATGLEMTWKDLRLLADRIYTLIRAFWIREFGANWTRNKDLPPQRWFKDPLSKGPLKGAKLDSTGFDAMLSDYYHKRGWDERGIPTRSTLNSLGLTKIKLERFIKLKD
ncbi:MAG: aldehyde ferredoxin oxidoreductase family protein [Candidatus Bathyarchaeota archaeon]|jgi:aldehyde:ferredoxin oxidoreductase